MSTTIYMYPTLSHVYLLLWWFIKTSQEVQPYTEKAFLPSSYSLELIQADLDYLDHQFRIDWTKYLKRKTKPQLLHRKRISNRPPKRCSQRCPAGGIPGPSSDASSKPFCSKNPSRRHLPSPLCQPVLLYGVCTRSCPLVEGGVWTPSFWPLTLIPFEPLILMP